MRPNRPHIPSYITFSKSTKTKQIQVANLLAFPETAVSPEFPNLNSAFRSAFPLPVVFASVRHRRCFASVRRYLRTDAGTRKREMRSHCIFFTKPEKHPKSWGWRNFRHKRSQITATFLRPNHQKFQPPKRYPQTQARLTTGNRRRSSKSAPTAPA